MKKDAIWITAPRDMGVAACTFQREFSLPAGKSVKKATLCVSAIGIYKTDLNGVRVDKSVLAPGWTCYKDRVQYATIDVTDKLKRKNTLSIGVGQGWAVGYIGYKNENHFFADRTSLIAWLDVTCTDGTKICTFEQLLSSSDIVSLSFLHSSCFSTLSVFSFVSSPLRGVW